MNKKQLTLCKFASKFKRRGQVVGWIILFFLVVPAFAQGELHQEEGLKITLPFGKSYNYEDILVTRVVDGNTLQLENGERVRLIGIDCPAIDTEGGKKATEFVKGFVEGKQVRLEFDVEKRDKYGRLLAYVYLPLMSSDKYSVAGDTGFIQNPELVDCKYQNVNFICDFVNATIIKNGYASPITIPPNVKYADLFKELYKEARENKRGLWKESKITKEDAIRIAQDIWNKRGLKLSNLLAYHDRDEWVIKAESFIEGRGDVILTMRLDEQGNWINDGNAVKEK